MNKFEHFTLIYYIIDAYYEEMSTATACLHEPSLCELTHGADRRHEEMSTATACLHEPSLCELTHGDVGRDEDNKSEELRLFLSDMCPFTFKDIGSAVPYVYNDYCDFIKDTEISVENSYDLALSYIEHLISSGISCVNGVFDNVSKEMWINGAREYLTSEHKGMDI